jgi:hypothetical protein
MTYRKANEAFYFGSNFNKWLSQLDKKLHGRNTQTINNIDCIQLKWIGNTTYIRITESKHYTDTYGQNQNTILDKLAEMSPPPGIVLEVYTLWGDPPYDKVVLYNHKTKETTHMNRAELEKFALFKNVKR